MAWRRTFWRRRHCVAIDKQLEMKCNSEGNAKGGRSCVLSAADLPAYQVCTQPDLSIYLFVDIGNPILWVFISFDFALIFNCFSHPLSAFTHSPHFIPGLILLIITFAGSGMQDLRGPCSLRFFCIFISQCGKLFVFRSLRFGSPSLSAVLPYFWFYEIFMPGFGQQGNWFFLPPPGHGFTHFPVARVTYMSCDSLLRNNYSNAQSGQKDHAPSPRTAAPLFRNRCWHVSRQRINKYFIISSLAWAGV